MVRIFISFTFRVRIFISFTFKVRIFISFTFKVRIFISFTFKVRFFWTLIVKWSFFDAIVFNVKLKPEILWHNSSFVGGINFKKITLMKNCFDVMLNFLNMLIWNLIVEDLKIIRPWEEFLNIFF